MKAIPIIIADDHLIFRVGLKNVLDKSGEFTVVGEAEDGEQLLDLMAETSCEIVILDLRMSDRDDGLEALKAIKKDYPGIKVLIMSQVCHKTILDEVLEAGGDGYITKNDISDMLIPILKSISNNIKAFSPKVQALISGEAKELGIKLTRQETDILKLLVAGQSCDESADYLNISVSTVNFHRRNIKEKLQAKNQAEMIRIATEKELF